MPRTRCGLLGCGTWCLTPCRPCSGAACDMGSLSGLVAQHVQPCRTLALLATGAVAAASGDTASAKQRLTKALKLAHARLCNHLLVWQVLLVLAPLQAGQSDVAGAHSMLDSARTLSTSAQFVPGQVCACLNCVNEYTTSCGNRCKRARRCCVWESRGSARQRSCRHNLHGGRPRCRPCVARL